MKQDPSKPSASPLPTGNARTFDAVEQTGRISAAVRVGVVIRSCTCGTRRCQSAPIQERRATMPNAALATSTYRTSTDSAARVLTGVGGAVHGPKLGSWHERQFAPTAHPASVLSAGVGLCPARVVCLCCWADWRPFAAPGLVVQEFPLGASVPY